MRNLRRILGIRWFDNVMNVEVKDHTRLEDIESRIRRRRLAFFGHVARMPPGVPAHDALWTALYGFTAVAHLTRVGSDLVAVQGLTGPSSSEETWVAWASGRPGIWLWIGIDRGSSVRAFAAQA